MAIGGAQWQLWELSSAQLGGTQFDRFGRGAWIFASRATNFANTIWLAAFQPPKPPPKKWPPNQTDVDAPTGAPLSSPFLATHRPFWDMQREQVAQRAQRGTQTATTKRPTEFGSSSCCCQRRGRAGGEKKAKKRAWSGLCLVPFLLGSEKRPREAWAVILILISVAFFSRVQIFSPIYVGSSLPVWAPLAARLVCRKQTEIIEFWE